MPEDRPVTDRDLAALLDEARGDEAAAERTRRRWLRQQALADARLSGVLLHAVEAGHAVTLRTQSGRAYAGTVTAVGPDFCAIATSTATTLLRLSALAVVLPDVTIAATAAADHRASPQRTTFTDVLADRAAERPTATVELLGAIDPLRGVLAAVGVDVVTLVLDGHGRVAYVSLESVAAVSFLASG